MNYIRPNYSRKQVNKAGKALALDAAKADQVEAMAVLDNWRASHEYPVNVLRTVLMEKLQRIDTSITPSHRLKRAESILAKLRLPSATQLARMQDIGGLRVVLPEIAHIRALASMLLEDSRFENCVRQYDYISAPRESGYRGVHLVFTHHDNTEGAWDGLHVELQLRTGLQHAWATTVETAGAFLGQNLKGGQGDPDWLSFFASTSWAIAVREDAPLPSGLDVPVEVIHERVRSAALRLNAVEILDSCRTIVTHAEKDPDAGYFLLTLNTPAKSVEIRRFGYDEFIAANNYYTEAERLAQTTSGVQVVLVSAGPFEEISRAYPSYFLDAKAFVEFVKAVIESGI